MKQLMARPRLPERPATQEEIESIKDHVNRGIKKSEIGRQIGRSEAWVYKMIVQHQINTCK